MQLRRIRKRSSNTFFFVWTKNIFVSYVVIFDLVGVLVVTLKIKRLQCVQMC